MLKNCVFYSTEDRTILEIHYDSFSEFSRALYSIIRFDVEVSNYKTKFAWEIERKEVNCDFCQITDFWGENS